MIKCTAVIAALSIFPCTSLMARTIMTDIADAGIYCDTFSPDISRFYDAVNKKCVGKATCWISATMVTSKADLLQHKCTGFFAAPVCGGTPKNVETHKVLSKLRVSCDR